MHSTALTSISWPTLGLSKCGLQYYFWSFKKATTDVENDGKYFRPSYWWYTEVSTIQSTMLTLETEFSVFQKWADSPDNVKMWSRE